MSQDTLMLEWQQIRERLLTQGSDSRKEYDDLVELEEHMVNKGYSFHYDKVTNIVGDIVWKRK